MLFMWREYPNNEGKYISIQKPTCEQKKRTNKQDNKQNNQRPSKREKKRA